MNGSFDWTPNVLQAGKHQITFIATNAAQQSSTAGVSIDVDSGTPVLSTSDDLTCSPGAIGTWHGKWLLASGGSFYDPSGISLELGGSRVKINGLNVPLLSISPIRATFLCPNQELGTPLSITLETALGISPALNVKMQAMSPEIFSFEGASEHQVVITFAGTSDIATIRSFRLPGHPAQPDDHIVILGTGFGSATEITPGIVPVLIGCVLAELVSLRSFSDHPVLSIV